MQISMMLSYARGFRESAEQVAELETVGLDLVWVAEAYGFDGPSFMGYLAAKTERVQIGAGILPIYTRTPTLIAMTAAGLDAISEGRFQLGLGASGPQVIEGWHGVQYSAPVRRTREVIEICRKVWAREEPLVHEGRVFTLPLPAGEGTGLGKPLKIIGRPVRSRIPIWVASLGEKNVEMTAEVADGWLPFLFVPEKAAQVWGRSLEAGRAKRDPGLGALQISAGGPLAIGEGPEVRQAAQQLRPRCLPSTSAAWGPRERTSTTTSSAGTASSGRPARSRTSTCRARRKKRLPGCRTRSSRPCRSADRSRSWPNGSRPSRRQA